jgi:hypothetical protein
MAASILTMTRMNITITITMANIAMTSLMNLTKR